jgi:hypothetical protein
MRLLSLAAVSTILVGCGASANAPTTVDIPTAPVASSSPPPQPAPAPAAAAPRDKRAAAAARLSELLREASSGQRSFELEPSGRAVIKDLKEPREEEFHLEDVDNVMYYHESGRKLPHWVRVYIKQSGYGRTRWRQRNPEWQIVTSPFLVLPFKDKGAADEAVTLMQAIVGS